MNFIDPQLRPILDRNSIINPPSGGGGFNPAPESIGNGRANPYNDADKFILMGGTNYNNKQATLGKGYSVFADQYGNIIG